MELAIREGMTNFIRPYRRAEVSKKEMELIRRKYPPLVSGTPGFVV